MTVPRPSPGGLVDGGRQLGGDPHVFGKVEQIAGPILGAQQGLNFVAQGLVVTTGTVQEHCPLGG